MTNAPVIKGNFAHWLPIKGRSAVRLEIEVPVEDAHRVMDVLGFPEPGKEIPVAIARLTPEAAEANPTVVTSNDVPETSASARKRWHELSRAQRAGMRCAEFAFRTWITGSPEYSEAYAAHCVRHQTGVKSRNEFDTDAAAAARWDALETRFMQETGRMAVDR